MTNWEIATPSRNSGRYVSVRLHDGRLRVSVSHRLRSELNWNEEDRVAVFFGKDAERGKIRIARDPRGFSGRGTGKEGSRSLHLTIRHPIGLVQQGTIQRVEFAIDKDAVVATLPPEFLAKEE